MPFRREVLATPDGDELLLDDLDVPAQPLQFVVMHGLEGSSYSPYVQGLLALIDARGHSATVLNFRSCAREPHDRKTMIPNRRPRFYHSGETGDFEYVVQTLRGRHPGARIVAFGASLGANVLLKWLGDNPQQTDVARAAALSVPFDLGAGARQLERGAGPLYVASFLRSMRPKARRIVERFPETGAIIDLQAVERARSFYQFDDAVTAPLHGFSGAEDYYTRASSIHVVDRIATPTLCINAIDDPFVPRATLAQVHDSVSPAVDLRITSHGGHAGFVATAAMGGVSWAQLEVVEWLERLG